MLCILYVNLVGACLGIAGLLVERLLPARFPRRWVWCVVIAISIVLPGTYRYHHNVPVDKAAPLAAIDPGWWALLERCSAIIGPFWLISSGVLILWGLANIWRVSRVVSRAQGDARAPGIVDGVPIVVTDSIGPATAGLLRSRVLVPRWVLALPGIQRRYVLRHEEEHRSAHDAHLLFVMSLPLLLMPWNVAFWWQMRRLRLAVEMDCDNRVVTKLGDAHAYGELLLKVAQAASRGPRLQPAFLGGVGMLERRLTVLLAPTRLRYVQQLMLSAVALGLLALVLSMPHPMPGTGSHEHAAMTSATTQQR